jgi:chorismate mutase/prephenate dehydrogenase
MVSGLSMPVGLKNGTDGDLLIAVNGMKASAAPQTFIGIDSTGRASIVKTKGNPYTHIVLRGGIRPNYDSVSVNSTITLLKNNKLRDSIIIDCSHGNSSKDYRMQPRVWQDVINQRIDGNDSITGLMLESNIHEGSQTVGDIPENIKYGVSITDACISWEVTEELIISTFNYMKQHSDTRIRFKIESDLEKSRDRIDQIDLKIIDLLTERQSEVEKVIAIKKKNNLPVRHPAREEDMISRRRSLAKEKGLDPDYVEELFRSLLRQSRVEQTESKSEKGVRPDATVLIIGGKGGMGEYFARWFKKSGYKTRLLGRNDWDNLVSLCDGIDLAIISVPIESTLSVIERLAPYLPEKAVLADLTSIKKEPVGAMLNMHKGPVLGIHPLFGPSTSSMDKQIIVVTPGRDEGACKWIIDQMAEWGAIIVLSNGDEHDRIMAFVQALRHFATFTFGRFLYKKNIDLFRSLEFSSPIYRLELGMVGRLFAQAPDLYSGIIFASDERRSLLKDYITSITELISMVEKLDKRAFEREFKEIATWFGPFSEQALRESTFLIDKLIERF